jgi:hypothetical protein
MANTINWGQIYCSSWWGNETNKLSVPEFPEFCALIEATCGNQYTYTGNQDFPESYVFNLGVTGTSTLTYQAFSIPDKWVIMQDGVVILDTGYRGDAATYQTALDNELASRGLPPETIQGVGSGTANFTVSSTSPVYVFVYAPLPNTSFRTTISCPT